MEDKNKKFNSLVDKYEKKYTAIGKKAKVGLIVACALLGGAAITTSSLFAYTYLHEKDSTHKLEDQIVDLTLQIEKKSQAIDTLQSEIADLKVQLEEAEKAHSEEVTKLKEEIKTKETAIDKLTKEKEELNKTITDLKKQITDLENKAIVIFVKTDYSNAGDFKIDPGITFEAAGYKDQVPAPTSSSYEWVNFDVSKTTFTAKTVTLIKEQLVSINISPNESSFTENGLTNINMPTTLTKADNLTFTVDNNSGKTNFSFRIIGNKSGGICEQDITINTGTSQTGALNISWGSVKNGDSCVVNCMASW